MIHPITSRSRALAALLLATTLAAQSGQPDAKPAAPVVVTKQEQNQLRATAFAAKNDGRFSAAADAFLQLAAAAPERIDWVVAAGECLGSSGRFREAVGFLDAARARFQGAVEVNALLARTLLLQTERDAGVVQPEVNWAEAAAIADDVLRRDPRHADCRLLLAQARYLLGEWDEASRQADEAARLHPNRPGAHVLVGRIAADRVRLHLQELDAVEEDEAARAQVVKRLHQQRLIARNAFGEALRLDPSRAYPHVALSKLATLDGEPDQARRHLHDALAIDPELAVDHALLTRGMTWQARRDLYRGLRERFEAAANHPAVVRRRKNSALRFYEAKALLEGLQFEAALAGFAAVRDEDPGAHNVAYYSFLCSYHLGDYDAAERFAAEYAQRSAPGFADVLRELATPQRVQVAAMVQFLGDRAWHQQRIENSRDLNHVTACLKDSADAWNNHAFLCRETGAYERALTSYQYALQREPDSPQLWNDCGVVLHYHLATPKDLQKARRNYDRALALAAKIIRDADASTAQRQAAEEAAANARLNLADLDKRR